MYTHTISDITMRFRCHEPEYNSMLVVFYHLPSILKSWNNLPPEIKDWPSHIILKSRFICRVDHDKVRKYYYYGPYYTLVFV